MKQLRKSMQEKWSFEIGMYARMVWVIGQKLIRSVAGKRLERRGKYWLVYQKRHVEIMLYM